MMIPVKLNTFSVNADSTRLGSYNDISLYSKTIVKTLSPTDAFTKTTYQRLTCSSIYITLINVLNIKSSITRWVKYQNR